MASTKRQRKKENQAARRAALEAARRRQRRRRQLLTFASLTFGVLLLAVVLWFGARLVSDEEATPATTTTAPPVTLATLPPAPPGRTVTGPTPCPKASGEERATTFEQAPTPCLVEGKKYRAVFTTSKGMVKVDLDTKRTPLTTNNFVVLARYGYYDGSSLPRTDPELAIIQGGSPSQSIDDPGPGYMIKDEGAPFTYTEGDLVMARGDEPDSASAQYFFSAGPGTANLNGDGSYVTFGKVVEGLDVLKEVLASHVDCPPPDPAVDTACLSGAPQPPVKVETVVIEES